MKKQIRVLVLCAAMVFSALQAQAATVPLMDSSQMNLNAINAVSGVSVVSVGTVIVWGTSKDPHDADKWLECDGRAFSAATYPDLASIYPSLRVPDYRNQFVRGGTTAQVGQVAGDSTRSHVHQMVQHQHTVSGSSGVHAYQAPAAGGAGATFVTGSMKMGARYTYTNGETTYSSNTPPQYLPRCRLGDPYNATGPGYCDPDSKDAYGNYHASFLYENVAASGGGSQTAYTSGGPISGLTNMAGPTSTYSTGGAETAPQHIRVRYLIRALP